MKCCTAEAKRREKAEVVSGVSIPIQDHVTFSRVLLILSRVYPPVSNSPVHSGTSMISPFGKCARLENLGWIRQCIDWHFQKMPPITRQQSIKKHSLNANLETLLWQSFVRLSRHGGPLDVSAEWSISSLSQEFKTTRVESSRFTHLAKNPWQPQGWGFKEPIIQHRIIAFR